MADCTCNTCKTCIYRKHKLDEQDELLNILAHYEKYRTEWKKDKDVSPPFTEYLKENTKKQTK